MKTIRVLQALALCGTILPASTSPALRLGLERMGTGLLFSGLWMLAYLIWIVKVVEDGV